MEAGAGGGLTPEPANSEMPTSSAIGQVGTPSRKRRRKRKEPFQPDPAGEDVKDDPPGQEKHLTLRNVESGKQKEDWGHGIDKHGFIPGDGEVKGPIPRAPWHNHARYQEKQKRYAATFPKGTGTKGAKKFQKYLTVGKLGSADEALKEAQLYAHTEVQRKGVVDKRRKEPVPRLEDNRIQPCLGGITLRLDQKLYVASTFIPGKRGHRRLKITVAQWGPWAAAYEEAERRALQYEGRRPRGQGKKASKEELQEGGPRRHSTDDWVLCRKQQRGYNVHLPHA